MKCICMQYLSLTCQLLFTGNKFWKYCKWYLVDTICFAWCWMIRVFFVEHVPYVYLWDFEYGNFQLKSSLLVIKNTFSWLCLENQISNYQKDHLFLVPTYFNSQTPAINSRENKDFVLWNRLQQLKERYSPSPISQSNVNFCWNDIN